MTPPSATASSVTGAAKRLPDPRISHLAAKLGNARAVQFTIRIANSYRTHNEPLNAVTSITPSDRGHINQ